MDTKPEFPPLLAPGLAVKPLPELKELLVSAFPDSGTRAHLWESLMLLIKELRDLRLLPVKLWLDGSFLTEKIDPDDIDICVEIDTDRLNASTSKANSFLKQLPALHDAPRKLHIFLIQSAPAGHPDRINYLAACEHWALDFGTALISGQKKGVAILEINL